MAYESPSINNLPHHPSCILWCDHVLQVPVFDVIIMHPFYLQGVLHDIAHNYLSMAALFHIARLMTFRPPATPGLHIFSHDTSAFLETSPVTVHRNVLHTASINS